MTQQFNRVCVGVCLAGLAVTQLGAMMGCGEVNNNAQPESVRGGAHDDATDAPGAQVGDQPDTPLGASSCESLGTDPGCEEGVVRFFGYSAVSSGLGSVWFSDSCASGARQGTGVEQASVHGVCTLDCRQGCPAGDPCATAADHRYQLTWLNPPFTNLRAAQ